MKPLKDWLGSGSINLFGLPFAGKDTQAKILGTLFGGEVLSSGDVLRHATIPEHVKAIMDAGKLISSEDFLNIFIPYLSKPEFAGKPLLLSSVGKRHREEDGVLNATNLAGHPVKAVIFLNMPEEVVWERWETEQKTHARGPRIDDALSKIVTRLQEFRSKTLPVLEFYKDKGLLIQVDTSQSINKVTDDIINALLERAKSGV